MWKVKRMNTARIVDVTIANGVAGIAAFLAGGADSPAGAPAQAIERATQPGWRPSRAFLKPST